MNGKLPRPDRSWVAIIRAVADPLGFLTFTVLIIWAITISFAAFTPDDNRRFWIIIVAFGVILLLAAAAYALYSRGVLGNRSRNHYSIKLVPSERIPGFDLSRISWDKEKCKILAGRKSAPVYPALHGVSTALEVRIPYEFINKLTDTEAPYLQLFDDHGIKWESPSFYVDQLTLILNARRATGDIIKIYGEGA